MQFISDTANGFQVFWLLRIILNAAADTTDMHHDGIVIVIEIFLPYGMV
jgi:hypothetical protein